MSKSLLASWVLLAGVTVLHADDWPRWRGPTQSGISTEKNWLDRWPADGPKVAWKAQVGTGFSAVSVSEGRLFTLGHDGENDVLVALQADTGKLLWSHKVPAPLDPNLFEGGPTATPTLHKGRVYSLSRRGDVSCLDAQTGKVVWQRSVLKDAKNRIPTWGFSGSPTVFENLLLLNVCEAGLALSLDEGKTVWASGENEAGYSTPVLAQLGKSTVALLGTSEAYLACDPKTGKELWRVDWPTQYGVNSADPILTPQGQLFVSSGYNKGAAWFELMPEGPKQVWKNKNLRNQMNSTVLLDGYLFGIDGDQHTRASLKCLEAKTGIVQWTYEKAGCGSLMAADGKLIVLSDRGELSIGVASPKGFTPTAQAQVLEGRCWTVPVLANGRLYCRNAAGDLVCLDVRTDRK